jgi:CHAD domain-containing protein
VDNSLQRTHSANNASLGHNGGVATVHREVETKFDVPPDYVVPDLGRFADPDDRLEIDEVKLASTYHDTPDLQLLRFRLTLRRRLGDADTGWHLKVPGAGERTELHWPPDGEELPAEAAGLLTPFLRGAPVAPVVRLDVTRTRHRLLAATGELRAEVAHDDVRAVGLAAQVRAPRWHEVEAELGTGSRDLLAVIGRELGRAGAFASSSRSKLARSVLGVGNEGVGSERTSAGAVLIDYISQQSDAIVAGYFAIQRDEPNAVHPTRVASRRLRSTLRSFERCFDAEQAVQLEEELKWYAGVLGEVRDREVLLGRLQAAVDELPTDLVVGPIAEQITTRLASERAMRRAELLDVMKGERYADLLECVASWRADPPFTAAAGRPAATLRDDIDRMERKLSKRLAQATEPASSAEDMHRARKTGKRVRYAAEAAAEDSKLVSEITALQDLLGEFQDSIGAQNMLRALAADAAERGENGFTYGVLVAKEGQRADEARRLARKKR